LAQSRSQQQAKNLAVGELQLGIWRQMAVDAAGDVELIEQGLDQRQGTQIDDCLGAGSTMPLPQRTVRRRPLATRRH
jgi:hypothetical protein